MTQHFSLTMAFNSNPIRPGFLSRRRDTGARINNRIRFSHSKIYSMADKKELEHLHISRSHNLLRCEVRMNRQTTTREQSGPNAGSRQLAGLTNRVEPCSQRDAVATEQQGLQGNSMSKELPNRGALGAIWALSSAVPETTQRASREKLSRNSRMQILRRQQVQRNPVQNTVEEALGMPRMTRNRKIPGGTVAMN